VAIAVADPAAIQQHHVIEQRAITIRCRAQFLEIRGKQGDVIQLDLRALLHLRVSF
jgi:hypothetical protein